MENGTTLVMEKYQYTDLPSGQYIHTLILESGQGDDPLCCHLQTGVMENFPFEALSYVWGVSPRNREVICDDRRLLITPNLEKALQHVRHPHKQRRIWADSICINQEDLNERGHQVFLMDQLYAKAKEVLIYIGEESNGHDVQAESLIKQVSSMILQAYSRINFSPDSFPYPNVDDPILTDPRWESFNVLMDAPWFHRGWVVQESGLAQEATILFGDVKIPWLSFIRTYHWALRRGSQVSGQRPRYLSDMFIKVFKERHKLEMAAWFPLTKTQFGKTITSLPNILYHGRGLSLTDERDRVYAFLMLAKSMLPSLDYRLPYADYSSDYMSVYADFSRTYLLHTGDLTLLNYIQHDETTVLDDSPTWAPRWNLDIYYTSINIIGEETLSPSSCKNEHHRMTLSIPTPTVLRVRGVLFDEVGYVSTSLDGNCTIQDLSKIWMYISSYPISPYGSSVSDRLTAFGQCITGSTMRQNYNNWMPRYRTLLEEIDASSQTREPTNESNRVLCWSPQGPDDSGTTDSVIALALVRRKIHNRAVIQSSRGYIGLAPGICQPGDRLAVIYGGRAPFILRAHPNRPGHYRIVGDAWIASKNRSTYTGVSPGIQPVQLNRLLGRKGFRDWEDWSQRDEDILLV